MPRIGLVLGAGGVVGHAFHAGVLAAVAEATGWDPRDADVIVGTSAGSVVGALLRAGASAPDLVGRARRRTAVERGPAARRTRRRPLAAPRRRFPRDRRAARACPRCRHRARSCARRVAAVERATRRRSPRRSCPQAAFRPSSSRRACARCSPRGPTRRCGSTPSQLDTGRRVTFGRDPAHDDRRRPTRSRPRARSPAFFAPVVINGVRYVDGGVHSPTNADLLAGLGLDLVVVSSPMSIAGNGRARRAPISPRAGSLASRSVARSREFAGAAPRAHVPTRRPPTSPSWASTRWTRRAARRRDTRAPTNRRAAGSRRTDAARPDRDPQALGDVSASLSSSVIPASMPPHSTAMSGAVS